MKNLPSNIETWPRRKAVLFLVKQTSDPAVIAGMIGSTAGTVQTIVSRLRRDGHDIPLRRRMANDGAGYEIRSTLPVELADILTKEAKARRERPLDLARRIIAAVLSDDMVSAVLDTEK